MQIGQTEAKSLAFCVTRRRTKVRRVAKFVQNAKQLNPEIRQTTNFHLNSYIILSDMQFQNGGFKPFIRFAWSVHFAPAPLFFLALLNFI